VPAIAYAPDALADLERITEFLLESDAPAAAETAGLVTGAIDILRLHPRIGRPVEQGFRELVISRGRSGYLALYGYDEAGDAIIVYAIRHQREVGYD
jgi:plasmid stabilization system protein ParE